MPIFIRRNNFMRTLDDIKEDIHTINPDINEKTFCALF